MKTFFIFLEGNLNSISIDFIIILLLVLLKGKKKLVCFFLHIIIKYNRLNFKLQNIIKYKAINMMCSENI